MFNILNLNWYFWLLARKVWCSHEVETFHALGLASLTVTSPLRLVSSQICYRTCCSTPRLVMKSSIVHMHTLYTSGKPKLLFQRGHIELQVNPDLQFCWKREDMMDSCTLQASACILERVRLAPPERVSWP